MENVNRVSMAERYCALGLGITFLVIGIAGFIPAFVAVPEGTATNIPINEIPNAYAAGFGYLFGLFPTNMLHNIVHCIVGLLGIASFTNLSSTRMYNRGFAIAYLAIALMGLIPVANTTFGLMPIFGNNVWFNALTAAIAAYYSFFKKPETTNFTASSRT